MEQEILDLVASAEETLKPMFKYYDDLCLKNQEKVLEAFRENRIGLHHFCGTTGYGYDDIGREGLNKVYASYFKAEDALATPLITCGSHAVNLTLMALLRPGDTMLSITGKPYDTVELTLFGENVGGFKDYNISYDQINMKGSEIDMEAVLNYLRDKVPKIIFLQRSRGYEFRKSLSVYYMQDIIQQIKIACPSAFVVVDNCYGEFLEDKEPTEVGADVCIGSLTKNPGGGIAPCGAYVVGTQKAISLVKSRFTSPSLHTEVGSFEMGYRLFYQGFFMGPHTTTQALKGAYLIGEVMHKLGYDVIPLSNEKAFDIVKTIKFNAKEELLAFVQIIQKYSPVDSYVQPIPWERSGYGHEIVMGAGTFVQGATMELSCDAPMAEPYYGQVQGGLNYEHIKLVAMQLARYFWRG